MPIQFSPVVPAQPRLIPAFTNLQFIDLARFGLSASPLVVLDDFRVRELPFSPHPHAGFAAVTYVFEDSPGGLRSRTSTGADLTVGPGGIVWTQAGGGLIHEEVPAQPGVELHGLQLFVNLTSKTKLSPPRVLALKAGEVPVWTDDEGNRVRVVVGRFGTVSSPLVPDEPFTLLDIRLEGQLPYQLIQGQNAVIYVLSGSVVVGADSRTQRLDGGQALALFGGGTIGDEATMPAHLLILAGLAIHEPVVEDGPFIMNERPQIEEAMARCRSGAMGELFPLGSSS
jgi:redox-sensitive bicupin YhaK (pirin superfamily)